MTKKSLCSEVDKSVDKSVLLTQREYDIYFLLVAGSLAQVIVAKRLSISRQAVSKVVQKLLILGLIKPIKKHTTPIQYRATFLSPVVSTSEKKSSPVLSTSERTLRKKARVVKDKKTGKIKHWRRKKIDLSKRDYDTVVSLAGKRVKICRVHGIGYTSTIIHPPMEDVPWKPSKKGLKGVEQYDFKTELPDIGPVTFRRQKSAQYDELIIWMPERWFFEWELEEGEKLLEEAVWKARKWFQNKFKTYLGIPLQYRKPKYAFEIVDPLMKRFVHEKGTLDVVTSDGIVEMDESKKPHPEIEFPSIRQARAYASEADRLLGLEMRMDRVERSIDKLTTLVEKQIEFNEQIQESLGMTKELNKKKEEENQDKMFS